MKKYLSSFLLLALSIGTVAVLSGCQIATVRTLEEDRLAKEGFQPDLYVDSIWESELLHSLLDFLQQNSFLEHLSYILETYRNNCGMCGNAPR